MRTVKQVKTDLLSALAYGASGKSFAALAADDLLNPELIPSHYGLQFTVAEDPLGPPSYRYVEFRNDPQQNQSKTLYEAEKEWSVPGTFLKSIVLRSGSDDEEKEVLSAWVVFVPPFGKVLFASADDVGDLEEISSQSYARQIGLEFGYKDRPQTSWIWFDVGKTLSII